MSKPIVTWSELTSAIRTELGLERVKVAIKRVPPCETRHNDGRCIVEKRGYTVLVNEYIRDYDRMIAVLAHELRHVWQYETGFEMTLADNFAGKEEYDSAPEELDANTYGAIVAARYTGHIVHTWK
jgi:hypothetical protein